MDLILVGTFGAAMFLIGFYCGYGTGSFRRLLLRRHNDYLKSRLEDRDLFSEELRSFSKRFEI